MKQIAVEFLAEQFENMMRFFPIQFEEVNKAIIQAKEIEKQQQDEFSIEFTRWKDNNFLMYEDKKYYSKTSSTYFDIAKYVGKEKPTKYYTTKELLQMFKKEKGL